MNTRSLNQLSFTFSTRYSIGSGVEYFCFSFFADHSRSIYMQVEYYTYVVQIILENFFTVHVVKDEQILVHVVYNTIIFGSKP